MRTKVNKLLAGAFCCLGILMVLPLIGCSSGSSSNNNSYQCYSTTGQTVPNTSCMQAAGYYCQQSGGGIVQNNLCYNNGSTAYQCYQNGNTSAPVTYTYCQSGMAGYTCMYNGQTVAETSCTAATSIGTTYPTSSIYPNGMGMTSGPCVGPYYFPGGTIFNGQSFPAGTYICGNSDPNNCTGVEMINPMTNAPQMCQ